MAKVLDFRLGVMGTVTPSHSIPLAPGALPLVGHLVSMVRDPLGFVTSLPRHGDLVRIAIGAFQAIMVCDPDLTRRVLLDDQTFDKGGPLYERARTVVRNALGTCRHSEHRRLRRLTQPVFQPQRLAGYAQDMTAVVAEVLGAWRDGQVLDVSVEMQTIAERTTALTMFSATLPAALLHQAGKDVHTLQNGVSQRMLMPFLDRLPIPRNRRYQETRARLRTTLGGIIADRRASGVDRGDLLSALLAARDPESTDVRQGLSDAEISDQVVGFFAAGVESTATVLSWALHLLSQHPDLEGRLHAELDAVLGAAPPAHAHLPGLDLTKRVIIETLRLWPPGWVLTRAASVDTELGGHRIPAGTIVAFSPYLIHHRPDLYPEPDRFDPDRWDTAQRSAPPRDTFIPFGSGARKCIGDQFAMTEAILALATIAARWRLRALPGPPVRPYTRHFILQPRGLRLCAVARRRQA
jgi:cytochrome P450